MNAVADTGFVIAVAIATDHLHGPCLVSYRRQERIYLPQSTLTEVAYLLTRAGGNRVTAQFLNGLARTKYRLVALEDEDLMRTAELLEQYADTRVDFVDITLAAVAERLEIRRILTVDQRDFRILRPRHCEYFEVEP
jgi:uncharacterized protein